MDPRVQRRFEGYRDAMKAASFRSQPHRHDYRADTVTLGGTPFADLAASAGYRRGILRRRRPALGVLFECQRRQISVPGNLAIVGQ
jgi:LacI family gluconate utilization system Gnt-I transcriptional repressor